LQGGTYEKNGFVTFFQINYVNTMYLNVTYSYKLTNMNQNII